MRVVSLGEKYGNTDWLVAVNGININGNISDVNQKQTNYLIRKQEFNKNKK